MNNETTFLLEQEDALLGILLTTPEQPSVRDEVSAIVVDDDFSPRGRVIWRAIKAHNGKPVDYLTVADFLLGWGDEYLERAGGEEFLSKLSRDGAQSWYGMAPQYARAISDCGKERRNRELAERAASLILSGNSGEARDLLGDTSPNLDCHGTSWAEMSKVIGPIEWEWEPWLPKGLLVELVGESGTGKSILALHIAGCFLRGDPWPDGTPFTGKTGKVLWCEAESAQAINLERATEWGLPLENIIAPLDDPLTDVRVDDKEHMAAITRWARDPEVKLVILDSLSGLHGGDENAVKMMETVKALASLARDTGKPFMLLHHLRKRGILDVGGKGISLDRVRGSTAIVQTARVVWALDVPDTNAAEVKRLSVIKNNLARFPEPIGVTCDDDGVEFVPAPQEERKETLETKAVDLLYALLSKGAMTVPDLKDNFEGAGISWRTATRAGHKINVTMFKRKGDGLWVWSLPVMGEK